MERYTFQIYQEKDGHYYFCLKADDGKLMCTSQRYATRQDCQQAINTMKKVVFTAGIQEVQPA